MILFLKLCDYLGQYLTDEIHLDKIQCVCVCVYEAPVEKLTVINSNIFFGCSSAQRLHCLTAKPEYQPDSRGHIRRKTHQEHRGCWGLLGRDSAPNNNTIRGLIRSPQCLQREKRTTGFRFTTHIKRKKIASTNVNLHLLSHL